MFSYLVQINPVSLGIRRTAGKSRTLLAEALTRSGDVRSWLEVLSPQMSLGVRVTAEKPRAFLAKPGWRKVLSGWPEDLSGCPVLSGWPVLLLRASLGIRSTVEKSWTLLAEALTLTRSTGPRMSQRFKDFFLLFFSLTCFVFLSSGNGKGKIVSWCKQSERLRRNKIALRGLHGDSPRNSLNFLYYNRSKDFLKKANRGNTAEVAQKKNIVPGLLQGFPREFTEFPGFFVTEYKQDFWKWYLGEFLPFPPYTLLLAIHIFFLFGGEFKGNPRETLHCQSKCDILGIPYIFLLFLVTWKKGIIKSILNFLLF